MTISLKDLEDFTSKNFRVSLKEITDITLAYTTYQAGEKEGQELHPKAILLMVGHFGYGPGHEEWTNQHDLACEELSDIFEKLDLFKTRRTGDGGAHIRIPMC